jgi:hypothetical protein
MGLGEVLPLPFFARWSARFIHRSSSIIVNSVPMQEVRFVIVTRVGDLCFELPTH